MWFIKISSMTPSQCQTWFKIEVSQLRSATPVVTHRIGVLQICSNECWIRVRWINEKNNKAYETKRKETIRILFFTISNLKSAKTYKSRWVLLSRETVYSGISKLILSFPYSFQVLCTILSIVNFHTVLSMFPFLFYWSTFRVSLYFLLISLESRYCPFKRSIRQLNVPAATAENEEQYNLGNIIYIGFQNSYSSLSSFLW